LHNFSLFLLQISENGVSLKSDVHIDEAKLILFNCLLYKHLKMILENGLFVRSVVLKLCPQTDNFI